jgi:TATA-binding protein-associated factor
MKYAENLRPVLYTGNAKDRARLLPSLKKFDVVITSYEVVRNDVSNLEDMNWLYCILDEGHVIKNAKTKLTKAVKCMQAQHRLILSGTPIQNNVLELWSLFDFLMPGFLGTESSFNERFGKPILSNRDGKAKNGEAGGYLNMLFSRLELMFIASSGPCARSSTQTSPSIPTATLERGCPKRSTS